MNLFQNKPNIFIAFVINNRYIRWEEVPYEATTNDIKYLLETKYKIENSILEIEDTEIEESIFKCIKIKKFIRKKNENALSIRVYTEHPIKIPHDVM